MKRFDYGLLTMAAVAFLIAPIRCNSVVVDEPIPCETEYITSIDSEPVETVDELIIEPDEEPTYPLLEEIELLALVTMAEAEGESEYGKRLVIDTVLNRVDSGYWPNTITDVVYQPYQFTSMWNGRIDRCYVDDDIRQLVIDELQRRTDFDVVYFRTDRYSDYGTPLYQVGNHYFSAF